MDKKCILKIYQQISPLGNARESRDFVDQFFRIYDMDGNGSIDFKEFMIATDKPLFYLLDYPSCPEVMKKFDFDLWSYRANNCIHTFHCNTFPFWIQI